MKVVTILQAQAFQVFRPLGTFGYLPDAIKKLIEQYGFQDYPRDASQIFPPEGQSVAFRHGRVEIEGHQIVIDWLQIFSAGITITTHTGTSDSLAALRHVVDWATAHFDVKFEPVREPGFWSQLNVRFEKPLADLFPQLKPIAREIGARHSNFLNFRPQFELGSLQFVYEAKSNLTAIAFRIERAVNVSFDENLYLSDAPLTTEDHQTILTEFEAVCLR
jgi:hypothetical protein